MGKEAQKSAVLNQNVKKKFDECVAALTAMQYGPDGPPENTTLAEIEAFGHQMGRMLGRALHGSSDRTWELYVPWITACWQVR